MSPRIGALFAGYGGLDLAVSEVFGGHMAWYSEVDKGALKILAHRFPDVPNVGDVTTADWSTVEPIDILTGGSPCQDLSHAGKRQGMTEGTRSNLWVAMREAIAQLRPSIVVWENVRGAASAEATSDLEHCPGCMGDGRPGVVLRALGRVVGDLSDLGYVGQVRGLRAADVGATHGRFRYFLAAHPEGDAGRLAHGDGGTTRDATESGGGLDLRTAVSLLPTPRATDGTKGRPNQRGSSGDLMLPSAVAHLLPTPAVNDMGEGKTVERWDEWTDDMKTRHGNGNGHGKSLAIEAQRLLPTPVGADARGSRQSTTPNPRADNDTLSDVTYKASWGDYAAAIARWEHTLGRPAPAPTMTSSKGNPQLSPIFVEWMMGVPEGWVTDVPGITRNEALKALGNGVCPAQAAAALRIMLSWSVAA